MKISTKGRYALRMLVDIAENQGDGYVALKDVAKRQNVSKKYLEQIVALLNKPDIIKTNRGYQGGYRLAKSASDYRVSDILKITEGSLAPITCLEDSPVQCERASQCKTLYVWQGLYEVMQDYLDNISIQDIIDHSLDEFNFVI